MRTVEFRLAAVLAALTFLAAGTAGLAGTASGGITPLTAAVLALSAGACGYFAAYWCVRGSLKKPVGEMTALLGRADGAGARLPGAEGGAFGELRTGVNSMLDRLEKALAESRAELAGMKARAEAAEAGARLAAEAQARAEAALETVRTSAQSASEISQELSYAAEQLTSQAEEAGDSMANQKDRVTGTAAAMEEMNATVIEVSRSAEKAAASADATRTNAVRGAEVMESAVAAIGEMQEISRSLAGSMATLGERAKDIGQVIGVISDIADQTNLLALNAAIEAARAGDAGRGFAVVADEVRKLAEKTMAATSEVTASVRAIQEAVGQNLKAMDTASSAVERSTDLARQSGNALAEIVAFSEQSSDQVRTIATASEQQSAATEEINRSVAEIDRLADHTDAMMRASLETIRRLKGLADKLYDLYAHENGQAGSCEEPSKGQMTGILPKMFLDFTAQKYGDKVRDKLFQELGRPVFMVNRCYPDKLFRGIADTLSRLTGANAREVYLGLGRFTPSHFAKLYPKHMKARTLKEFLLGMNTLHENLTKDLPAITPPRFTYREGKNELVMTYHSPRGLFDYFEGILQGSADLFGESAAVSVRKLDDERAEARIRIG